uniref:Uncharacterized protein n=1 Tax=Anguilla anguilla TaxID=7936 RepID=A0A0E9P6F4_ANGAN
MQPDAKSPKQKEENVKLMLSEHGAVNRHHVRIKQTLLSDRSFLQFTFLSGFQCSKVIM